MDNTYTAILANIQSGDFQLALDGNGEFFTKIRRFIPDFKRITGNAQITIKGAKNLLDNRKSLSLDDEANFSVVTHPENKVKIKSKLKKITEILQEITLRSDPRGVDHAEGLVRRGADALRPPEGRLSDHVPPA